MNLRLLKKSWGQWSWNNCRSHLKKDIRQKKYQKYFHLLIWLLIIRIIRNSLLNSQKFLVRMKIVTFAENYSKSITKISIWWSMSGMKEWKKSWIKLVTPLHYNLNRWPIDNTLWLKLYKLKRSYKMVNN
jgi:hypothetical protein